MKKQFTEVPANKFSLAKRKPVFGVGINDADYMTSQKADGKLLHCPYYVVWACMLKRCYCEKYQDKNPTYVGCKACDEWLIFSAFKSWMIKQEWHRKELDKDILKQGNKIYGPQTCLFVTPAINTLLTSGSTVRGSYPQGVHAFQGGYRAQCSVDGKIQQVGLFSTPDKAREAYKKFKYKVIAEVASKQSEPLRSALLKYKIN